MIMNDKIRKGYKWTSISIFGQYILQTIVFLIIAREIGPEKVGAVAGAMVVINFTRIFVELGFPQSLVQRDNINFNDVLLVMSFMTFTSLTFMSLLYLFKGFFGELFNSADVVMILPVLSVILLVNAISMPLVSFLQRNLLFKHLTFINVLSSVFSFPILGLYLCYNGYGIWSLVFSNISFLSITMICALIITLRDRELKFNLELRRLKVHNDFTIYFTSARLANYIALEFDNFIVGWKFGVTTLGVYSRAYQLMTLPATLIGTIGDKVLFPVFSRLKKQEIKNHIYIALFKLSLFAIPISALVIAQSDLIVFMLLGSKWLDVAPILSILSISLYFRIATKFIDATIRSLGLVKERAKKQYIYAFVIITLVSLASYKGIILVAYAVVSAIIFNYFQMLNMLSYNVGLRSLSIFKANAIHSIISILSVFLINLYLELNIEHSFLLNFKSIFIYSVLFMVLYFAILNFYKFSWRKLKPHREKR